MTVVDGKLQIELRHPAKVSRHEDGFGRLRVIAVDTNILARYYVDDPGDPEAARQRPVAERLMRESAAIFVPDWISPMLCTFPGAAAARP